MELTPQNFWLTVSLALILTKEIKRLVKARLDETQTELQCVCRSVMLH